MSFYKPGMADRNPLIGLGPADTMSQCAQVLEVVDLAEIGRWVLTAMAIRLWRYVGRSLTW